MTKNIKEAILQILLNQFQKEDCVIFLFGSEVQGGSIPSSDIDIGILCNHKMDAKAFLEAQEILDNNLPTLKKIDLVDFTSVSQTVKREALKEIEIWHIGENCRELLKSLKPV